MIIFIFPRYTLRKHAYLNILKILPPKNENFQINFQIKISDIFHISVFYVLSRNKKTMYTPVNPSFTN